MIPGEPFDAILRDGASIEVRAVRPDDRARLISLFERMSPGRSGIASSARSASSRMPICAP
jgi:hypothetical protein